MANPKGKNKFLLWLYPSTLDLVRNTYKKDHCQSQSQFIERAINYYVGHVNAEDDTSYLPNALLANLRGIVKESDIKKSRLLFKMAVEMAMMMNLMAVHEGIDQVNLDILRGECVKEVQRLNGSFSFSDAVKWQRGER